MKVSNGLAVFRIFVGPCCAVLLLLMVLEPNAIAQSPGASPQGREPALSKMLSVDHLSFVRRFPTTR